MGHDNNVKNLFLTPETYLKLYKHDSIVKFDCKTHFGSNGIIKFMKEGHSHIIEPRDPIFNIFKPKVKMGSKGHKTEPTPLLTHIRPSGLNCDLKFSKKYHFQKIDPQDLISQLFKSRVEMVYKGYKTTPTMLPT